MAVVATWLTLTPLFDGTKGMTVQGSVAAYETVAVTVTGVAVNDAVPAGLVLRVVSHCGRFEYARFPYVDGDAWTGSGSNATCSLVLNTSAIRDVFRDLCDSDTCEVQLKLENGATNNLYGVGRTEIRNWVQNPLDPVAGSLQMQAQLDVLTERIGGHQHDGDAESASFPHNNLTDRDAAGAHPAIEGAIATLSTSVGTAQSTAEVAGANASTALETAEAAKDVTDTIQDGGTFSLVASNGTLAQTKTLLNQIAVLLNTWRHA